MYALVKVVGSLASDLLKDCFGRRRLYIEPNEVWIEFQSITEGTWTSISQSSKHALEIFSDLPDIVYLALGPEILQLGDGTQSPIGIAKQIIKNASEALKEANPLAQLVVNEIPKKFGSDITSDHNDLIKKFNQALRKLSSRFNIWCLQGPGRLENPDLFREDGELNVPGREKFSQLFRSHLHWLFRETKLQVILDDYEEARVHSKGTRLYMLSFLVADRKAKFLAQRQKESEQPEIESTHKRKLGQNPTGGSKREPPRRSTRKKPEFTGKSELLSETPAHGQGTETISAGFSRSQPVGP